jgi:membrane protein DedA with SNARE-associated domain
MDIFHQIWQAIQTGTLPDLGYWSYLIIAILVAIEGPIIILIAAAMAAGGIFNVEMVFVAAVAGNLLSDTLWYAIGYFGGNRDFLNRFGWFRRRQRTIEQLEAGMHEHGVRIFLVSKVSLGLTTIPMLIAAGLARVRWYRLAIVSILVEPIWSGLLVLAGYNLGAYLSRLERAVSIIAAIGAIVVLMVLIALYRRMFRRVTHMDSVI